jgi:DNA-binding transcriptional ArsR family regulator
MNEILAIANRLEPEKALEEIGKALKSIFPVLSEESRGRFLMALVGGSQEDKVSSLVHL